MGFFVGFVFLFFLTKYQFLFRVTKQIIRKIPLSFFESKMKILYCMQYVFLHVIESGYMEHLNVKILKLYKVSVNKKPKYIYEKK